MSVITVRAILRRIDTPIPGATVRVGRGSPVAPDGLLLPLTDVNGFTAIELTTEQLIALEFIPGLNAWNVDVSADGYTPTERGFGFSTTVTNPTISITAELDPAPALVAVTPPTPAAVIPVIADPVVTPPPPVMAPSTTEPAPVGATVFDPIPTNAPVVTVTPTDTTANTTVPVVNSYVPPTTQTQQAAVDGAGGGIVLLLGGAALAAFLLPKIMSGDR